MLVGLVPALIHPDPDRAMAVGLGIGATPYGMSRDPGLGHLDVVEICGGEVDLLHVLAKRGAVEMERVLNSATEVFPHVLRFTVPSYDGSQFMVASQRPITFDRAAVLERYRALEPSKMFSPAQAARLLELLSTVEPGEVSVVRRIGEDGLNHDLAPRDEYFLNNSPIVQIRG